MDYNKIICEKLCINPNLVLKKKIRGLNGITAGQLIEALLSHETLEQSATHLGYSLNPVKQCVRQLLGVHFPDRSRPVFIGGGTPSWKYTLLDCIGYKVCKDCNTVKPHELFNNNSSNKNGLSVYCAGCNTRRAGLQKSYIEERTPAWADLDAIVNFYSKCPPGYEVDHILPLRGKLVSGLHVVQNLQYLTKEENRSKWNSFEV